MKVTKPVIGMDLTIHHTGHVSFNNLSSRHTRNNHHNGFEIKRNTLHRIHPP